MQQTSREVFDVLRDILAGLAPVFAVIAMFALIWIIRIVAVFIVYYWEPWIARLKTRNAPEGDEISADH